jgi:tape measure domain-containing protein
MAVNVRGGALEFDAVINGTQFQAQINAIEQSLRDLTNTAGKEADKIDNLMRKTTQAIAAYASFSAATNFVSDIVRVRGEFQQLEVAFQTMLGSKEKADKLMSEVTKFAATTPFELSQVAGATRSLLAFGISADKIKETLKALGDVSAGVGAPIEEIAQIYGKARVQGRLFAEDINQLTGRGIPIIQELAKQFKVNEDAVKGLVEAGKVGFPQIEQAFKDLTSAGSIFGGLMDAQAKTLTGQLSNLSDAWSRMLNDIGKSNEGVFNGAIGAAIKLVENYETVLDILKVLALTYGSYKAAVIATTAVQAIATSVTKGYTIAETLRYQAMLLSERAMKLLNATMLSNPAVAVTVGITALIAALVIFRKETGNVKNAMSQVKSESVLLNAAQSKLADSFADKEAKLRPYLETLKEGNVSEQQRLDIYNKLRAIDPDIVKGIDAKSLSYQNLKSNVDAYLGSLRKQLSIEANEDAVKASIKQEQIIQKQVEAQRKIVESLREEARQSEKNANSARAIRQLPQQEAFLRNLEKQLEAQQNISKSFIDTTDETNKKQARTVKTIQDEIKALKDQRDSVSDTSAKYKEFTEQIKKLEKELEAITGKDAAKTALKEAKDRQKELLDLLNDVAKAEETARRSGLTKEESEIDKINARYDELKKRAIEVKASASILQRIENARSEEAGNEGQVDKFNEYKKFIKDQQDVFTQFEDYKVKVGEKSARELTDFQTAEYADAIEFLKVQLALVSNDVSLSGKLKKDFLVQAIAAAENDKVKRETEKQVALIEKVVADSQTAAQKRLAIESKYEKDVQILRGKYQGKELDDRIKVLNEAKTEDLRSLAGYLVDQGKLYRTMNNDIVRFTKERIDKEIQELQRLLDNSDLDAVTRKAIEEAIKKWRELKKEITDTKLDDLIAGAKDFGAKALEIGGIFHDLASALEGVNDGLADTLATIGDIANIAGNAASGIASIASGDYIQGAASVVKAVAGIFTIGKKARESEKQAQKEILAFQDQIATAEANLNVTYRERQREQVKLNKLKLQGIQDENKLLQEQRKANQKQYQDVLAQLQEQAAVIGKGTEKYGGVLGIGRKTRATDITESLAGKSFEELEALFLKGQLEGKAKELFETLQRIKNEGVDIDRLLEENAEAARQLFTGTTADSITDSIVDGFQNGLRSAADFADTFEQLMKNAVIQSLKMQALEGPLKDFFADFAAAAESGNVLTDSEVQALQSNFSNIINDASQKFAELQRITNVDFSSATGSTSAKNLTGAVRGITEQTAELIAGQFGGLRLTALDHLKVASAQLTSLQAIQNHTSRLIRMDENLQWMRQFGIELKK